MRSDKWVLVVSMAVLLLVLTSMAACAGGTSGSVVGSHQSCSSRVDSGSCKGSYRKLSGTYSEDVENDRVFYGGAIQVKVELSVESGVVRASVESPDGEVSSVDVSSSKAAILEGVAKGSAGKFIVRFEAVDGEATGVSYEIVYQIP